MMNSVETVIELALAANYLSCLDKTRLASIDEGVFKHEMENLNSSILYTINLPDEWLDDNNLDEETFAEMLNNKAMELGVEGINNLCSSYWSAGYRKCYGKHCYKVTKEIVNEWGYARFFDNKDLINAFWCINCFEINCLDVDGNMFEQPSAEYCCEIKNFRDNNEKNLRRMMNDAMNA